MNYVAIFADYPFTTWFMNSLIVALLTTAIALPLATALAYVFARWNTGGVALRLSVLASQMLPPIILVLPLWVALVSLYILRRERGRHAAAREAAAWATPFDRVSGC